MTLEARRLRLKLHPRDRSEENRRYYLKHKPAIIAKQKATRHERARAAGRAPGVVGRPRKRPRR